VVVLLRDGLKQNGAVIQAGFQLEEELFRYFNNVYIVDCLHNDVLGIDRYLRDIYLEKENMFTIGKIDKYSKKCFSEKKNR